MIAYFVTADSSLDAYQSLSKKYSAIEPPTWSLLLAESCRSVGYKVKILDCIAEKLSLEESIERILAENARVILFVVYGQNPNAGTTSMIGAERLSKALKDRNKDCHISFVGSHTSALPKEVLSLSQVDTVLLNEGVYALRNLLNSDLKSRFVFCKRYWLEIKRKALFKRTRKNSSSRKNGSGSSWVCMGFTSF